MEILKDDIDYEIRESKDASLTSTGLIFPFSALMKYHNQNSKSQDNTIGKKIREASVTC